MTSHRHALERLAAYLDGLRTPIDGWQVAKQMQQIAREALGWPERPAQSDCPICNTPDILHDCPDNGRRPVCNGP